MFNPSRLSLARQRRGLGKIKLAKAAGVSARSITAYEAGETQPTDETIERLSRVLRFPRPFFFADDIESLSAEFVSFRSLKSMTSSQRDAALGAGTLAVELADWLDTRFELPEVNLPNCSEMDPESAAECTRAAFGMGEAPVANMIHLLESRGVRVFSLAEECLSVDAFSFWRNGRPFVFLNTRKSAERSRLDAAHELGHLVLHKENLPRIRDVEREAQKFGSAFLMPRAGVLASIGGLVTIQTIMTHKQIWGASAAALTYRLHDLGLVTDWQYRTLFKELSARGYRTEEPLSIARESSLVLAKVLAMLRDDGIGKRELAKCLNLSAEELNSLVFGLTILTIDGASDTEMSAAHVAPALRLVSRGE